MKSWEFPWLSYVEPTGLQLLLAVSVVCPLQAIPCFCLVTPCSSQSSYLTEPTPWIIIDEMADSLIVKVSYAKRLLELQLSPSDSISVLKHRLEQETGVSVPRQRLFLKGTQTHRPDQGRHSDPSRVRTEACLSLSAGRNHRSGSSGGLQRPAQVRRRR